MRHNNSGRKFGRTPSHRKALFNNMARCLLIHGRIQTTEAKAKDLRRIVEPLVALAQHDTVHARRQAYRVLKSHQLVKQLFDEIGPQYAGIPGGYTRIYKLAKPRLGDAAPMAIIELTKYSLAKEKAAEESKVKVAPKVKDAPKATAASKAKAAPKVKADSEEASPKVKVAPKAKIASKATATPKKKMVTKRSGV